MVPFSVIFIIVLTFLLFFRFSIWLILMHLLKKYRRLLKKRKDEYKWDDTKKPVFNQEDEIKRDKEREEEQLQQLENVEFLPSITEQRQAQMKRQMQEERIVDVVKPIGKFTALILGQKLSYLASQVYELKNSEELGYWTATLHAKDRGRGNQKGRGI